MKSASGIGASVQKPIAKSYRQVEIHANTTAGVVPTFTVIPAQAGIHAEAPKMLGTLSAHYFGRGLWIPACAGMTWWSRE
jgi:hypothetical protein